MAHIAQPWQHANPGYPPGKVFQVPTQWNIKQSFIGADMTIKDAWGNQVFKAVYELAWGMKLNFMDLRTGEMIGHIRHRIRLFGLQKYEIVMGGLPFASVKQEPSFLKNTFSINAPGLGGPITVQGDWFAHTYQFCRGNTVIAEVHKRFVAWTDTYTVDIMPGMDVVFILACCIIIDKCTTEG
ncbi:LURP-one-related domain-containing protein [Ditylenchus destructor]|nr:LURP-one-related domain-containing protein [Ditylenchus destructor]